MRRQVLVSVFAVGASLAAWSGTASAGDYGYNDYGYNGCCRDYGYYGYYHRPGSTAPHTHDRYNNSHIDSEYAPPPPRYRRYYRHVYRHHACCDYGYEPRRYYHHSDYYHSDYRYRRYSDYRYRRWHRDDYDD